MRQTPRIFDRNLVRAHRRRAAAGFARHDFLHAEVAARMLERLSEVSRRFSDALDLGSRVGGLDAVADHVLRAGLVPGGVDLVLDEEALPFRPASFDLVLSLGGLHLCNDLPGALIQIKRALIPDGLFLAALPGGDSLFELRQAMLDADIAVHGGASPRVAPFADVRALGGLLQRAGFAMPVADADRIVVDYHDPHALMHDLRQMGEALALHDRRRRFESRAWLGEVIAAYAKRFSRPDGRVEATFEIIWLTGWAPSPDQPQPKRRGSATHSLAEALKPKR